jgi:hypothetical protein
LQERVHNAREQLRRLNIRYPGVDRQPLRAVIAATTGRQSRGALAPDARQWERIVAEVTAASTEQVVISSEFFCARPRTRLAAADV